jgi:hypothetical protein
MVKATFKEKKTFHQQIGLKFKEESGEVLHLGHSFVWCWNLETSEIRSEMPGKFTNMVLGKDEEDRVRNEEVLHRITEARNILQIIKRKQANWLVMSCVGSAF